MAGLTDTGLTIETIATLLENIVADELANISPTLNTEADSALGQLNAIFAAALLELWELLEEIYQSGFADTATGQSLSYIAAITGTYREEATRGTHTARFFGAVDDVVPLHTEYYPNGRPDSLFRTTVETTLTGSFANIATEAVVPGASTYVLSSEGQNLTMPNPPTGITNVETDSYGDSDLGQDEETDAQLRIRREVELARPGSSTVESIRADMLEVEGVDLAHVYENVTMFTDSNGLPPKSIECLVYSQNAPTYTAQAVIDALWIAKPAGTETYGGETGTATDSAGESHTLYYSEPADITTHVLVTYTYDASTGTEYVGEQAIKDAIVLWAADGLSMGDDVVASDLVHLVSRLGGIVSVDGSNTGADSSTVASGNPSLTVSMRQVATIVDGDIDLTGTAA